MKYTVITTKELDFSAAEVASIDKYTWGDAYTPITEARLIYVEDKGLALRMECMEQDPKATYFDFYDPVYKDSCMEFFSTFDNKHYMNIEMNANGALLVGFGAARKGRVHVDELIVPPKVKAGKIDGGWFVEIMLTVEDLRTLYPTFKLERGARFRGNFYKCGDETAIPHYGMWSPVGTETPNFHQPYYFGDFEIV